VTGKVEWSLKGDLFAVVVLFLLFACLFPSLKRSGVRGINRWRRRMNQKGGKGQLGRSESSSAAVLRRRPFLPGVSKRQK
jgi:hypothetical protein